MNEHKLPRREESFIALFKLHIFADGMFGLPKFCLFFELFN